MFGLEGAMFSDRAATGHAGRVAGLGSFASDAL